MATDTHRSWPRWLARSANLIPGLKWTPHYCAGGCGYPVTGAYSVQIDELEGVPVMALVCGLDGTCEYNVKSDMHDEQGNRYGHVRQDFIDHLHSLPPDSRPDRFDLSFSR